MVTTEPRLHDLRTVLEQQGLHKTPETRREEALRHILCASTHTSVGETNTKCHRPDRATRCLDCHTLLAFTALTCRIQGGKMTSLDFVLAFGSGLLIGMGLGSLWVVVTS